MIENQLFGQSLVNKLETQRNTDIVYMQISYMFACVVLLFHSQRVRTIRNGIRKDS